MPFVEPRGSTVPPAIVELIRQQPTGQFNAQSCTARIAASLHELVTYQPQSRYWPLQWYGLAIFLALAVVLGGLSIWWIRRPGW